MLIPNNLRFTVLKIYVGITVHKRTETYNIIEDIEEAENWFIMEGEDAEVIVPEDGVGEIYIGDSNGNSVETEYEISANKLVQTVEFNEESAFPIVADPKNTTKPKSKK